MHPDPHETCHAHSILDPQRAEAEEVAALIAAARATPKGDKKSTEGAMFKAYHPRMVEAAWWVWVRCGLSVVQG